MSSLPPDPYRILGVGKDAQIPEIRSAHRKLVLKCHPDKILDPTLKAQKQDEFQAVQQAYELLSDDRERSRYDDQIKLAELRKQKANISTPRTAPRYAEFEVRTAEPRPTTFRSSPSSTKPHVYSRSWEEDFGSGPRIYEAEIRMKREPSGYADKPTKREMEKERERERDYRERERERDKDKERERRRRYEEDARRAERAAEKALKEARRTDKKIREKQVAKDRKRDTERKIPRPYIEAYDDEDLPPPRSEKKKSSSRKYDEKRERGERERSTPREEIPVSVPPPMPQERSYVDDKETYATSYIHRSKLSGKGSSLPRSNSYYTQPPAAPTPPPVPGQSSAFNTPTDDEEVRRSSAKVRRGSAEAIKTSRDKTYKKSNERLGDPVDASPSVRPTAQFQRSSTATPPRGDSPPRHSLPRQNTMPAEPTFPRGVPGISRSKTFSGPESSSPRGRSRSRWQPQINEESESEEDYDRRGRGRDRGHRERRTHSPEAVHTPPENVYRYKYTDGRTQFHDSYTRHMDPEVDAYGYPMSSGSHRAAESRPMPSRESSYRTTFHKVKESPMYGVEDIQFSRHAAPAYRKEYAAYG